MTEKETEIEKGNSKINALLGGIDAEMQSQMVMKAGTFMQKINYFMSECINMMGTILENQREILSKLEKLEEDGKI